MIKPILLLYLLFALAQSDPDPIEDDEEEEPTPGPPPGGHWESIQEAQEACQFVCTRAYPKCDIIGCMPKREEATLEGCAISCCGDTSLKYCWQCVELAPGEQPDPPPKSCKPTESAQNEAAAGVADAVKLAEKPPDKDADMPKAPELLYALASDHFNRGKKPPVDTVSPVAKGSPPKLPNPTDALSSVAGKDSESSSNNPTAVAAGRNSASNSGDSDTQSESGEINGERNGDNGNSNSNGNNEATSQPSGNNNKPSYDNGDGASKRDGLHRSPASNGKDEDYLNTAAVLKSQ